MPDDARRPGPAKEAAHPQSAESQITEMGEAPTPASVFTKVSRYTIWRDSTGEGYHVAVQCAVRADRSSPAVVFLQGLRGGVRREDPEHRPPRDMEQIHDFHALIAKIEHVGFHGQPESRDDVNDLEGGVWEFRHGTRRLSYWDTPGNGTYDPKFRVDDIRTVSGAQPEDPWWYPDMDPYLRLGGGWDKDAQMAPPERIQEALDIREEDTAHDRH